MKPQDCKSKNTILHLRVTLADYDIPNQTDVCSSDSPLLLSCPFPHVILVREGSSSLGLGSVSRTVR